MSKSKTPDLPYLVVIPARGGSKQLPRKNILHLAGKPLIGWSIQHALSMFPPNQVLVSTDCKEIANIALEFGATVPFVRPEHLSQDESETEPVILHALDWFVDHHFEPEGVVLLQPTSPLRKKGALLSAIKQFEESESDSLLSVCESHHFFWKDPGEPKALYDYKNRPRRQDLTQNDLYFKENGSIYITKTSTLRECKNRLCGTISLFIMSEEESIEIDSKTDFSILNELISGEHN